MPLPTRRLDLRVDRPGDNPGISWHPDYRVVTILIDGVDLLARPGERCFIGFGTAEILVPEAPLLPTSPPRRVAVYQCNCGTPGCDSVAPLIAERDGRIVWSDFRDFTGAFDGPIAEDEPEDGRPLPIPDLAFDPAQYRAEVARAISARS